MLLNRKWKRRLFTIARGCTEVFMILGVTILVFRLLERLGAGLAGLMTGAAVTLIVISFLVVMLVEVPVQRLLRAVDLEEEQLSFRNTSLDPDAYHHNYQFGEQAGASAVRADAPDGPARADQQNADAPKRSADGVYARKGDAGSDYMPGFFGRSLKDFRWKPAEQKEEENMEDASPDA